MKKTFKIGQMQVTIEGNTVKTSHPTNEMKKNVSTFSITDSLRGGKVVVLNDRQINKHQSASALKKIKEEILKGE